MECLRSFGLHDSTAKALAPGKRQGRKTARLKNLLPQKIVVRFTCRLEPAIPGDRSPSEKVPFAA